MSYLIVAVVVVIFIAVVFIVAGKDSKERIDMVSKLTEEQRNILNSTEWRRLRNCLPVRT